MVCWVSWMCWFFWDAMIFCSNFMLPKRIISKIEKHFGGSFWALFQGVEYSFWATVSWKSAQNDPPTCFSAFENLRLGSINFARWLQKIVATCHVMCWFFWDATIFCNNFARWLQKLVATCGVLGFWDSTIFCNNFARWLQKIVATSKMSCDVLVFWDVLVLLGCYDLL